MMRFVKISRVWNAVKNRHLSVPEYERCARWSPQREISTVNVRRVRYRTGVWHPRAVPRGDSSKSEFSGETWYIYIYERRHAHTRTHIRTVVCVCVYRYCRGHWKREKRHCEHLNRPTDEKLGYRTLLGILDVCYVYLYIGLRGLWVCAGNIVDVVETRARTPKWSWGRQKRNFLPEVETARHWSSCNRRLHWIIISLAIEYSCFSTGLWELHGYGPIRKTPSKSNSKTIYSCLLFLEEDP